MGQDWNADWVTFAPLATSETTETECIVIIDDSDAVLSRDPSVQTTINQPLLDVFFQWFASDKTNYLNYDGSPIGLVFTGNDFTHTRSPVLRFGRADIVTHAPSLEEKIEVAQSVFEAATDQEVQLINRLVTKHQDQQLALWPTLARDLHKQRRRELYAIYGVDLEAIDAALAEPLTLTEALLNEALDNRLSDGVSKNFL